MTLIDGDRIITAQLYDDEHEEFTEKKMSIIDYVNAYTDEGVTEEDVVDCTKWIPVSERLPKIGERVMVTFQREFEETEETKNASDSLCIQISVGTQLAEVSNIPSPLRENLGADLLTHLTVPYSTLSC